MSSGNAQWPDLPLAAWSDRFPSVNMPTANERSEPPQKFEYLTKV